MLIARQDLARKVFFLLEMSLV